MVREVIPVDVSGSPDLLAVAQEVKRSGTTRVLSVNGEALARISPVPARKRRPRGKRISADDPIWDIVGMANTGEPTDVSEHVDEYLAEWELAQQQE